MTLNHKRKKSLTRTGVGPFEIGVRICSFLSKTGLFRDDITVAGVAGDKLSKSTVSSEQTDAVAKRELSFEK